MVKSSETILFFYLHFTWLCGSWNQQRILKNEHTDGEKMARNVHLSFNLLLLNFESIFCNFLAFRYKNVFSQESRITNQKTYHFIFFVSHTLCKSIAVGIKGSLWRCPLGQEGNICVIIGILKLSPWHMRLLIFIRVHSRFEFQVGNSNWSLYTRDPNVCRRRPVYEVRSPCFRGPEWRREGRHSH